MRPEYASALKRHSQYKRECRSRLPRDKGDSELTTETEVYIPASRCYLKKKKSTALVSSPRYMKRPETAPVRVKRNVYYDTRDECRKTRHKHKGYYNEITKEERSDLKYVAAHSQTELQKCVPVSQSAPMTLGNEKYYHHSFHTRPSEMNFISTKRIYKSHREPIVYAERDSSEFDIKSISSHRSSISLGVSYDVAEINKNIEALLERYGNIFESAIANEVEKQLGIKPGINKVVSQQSTIQQEDLYQSNFTQQPHQIEHEFQQEYRKEKPSNHSNKLEQQYQLQGNTTTTPKFQLTKEQQLLLEMDRPPIDKLKGIPIQFLKPRAPTSKKRPETISRKTNKNNGETTMTSVQATQSLANDDYIAPNVLLNKFMEDLSLRGFNLTQKVDSVMELIEEDQLKAFATSETFKDKENQTSGKNKIDQQPYIHPNVEKMFSKEMTKKVPCEVEPDKSVSTQTLNEEEIQEQNRNFLFCQMETERNGPYIDNINNNQENWRDVLAQQNKNIKKPLSSLLSFHSKTICTKNCPHCCLGPLEKRNLANKAINTDSNQNQTLIQQNIVKHLVDLKKDSSNENMMKTGKNFQDILVYQEQTSPETLYNISDSSQEKKPTTPQISNSLIKPLQPSQNTNIKGGGDTTFNLKSNTVNSEKEELKSTNNELEVLQAILNNDLSKVDYLMCLKLIQTITIALLQFNQGPNQPAEDHLKEMISLREDHIKYIQKEVHHLEELDMFLKKFGTVNKES